MTQRKPRIAITVSDEAREALARLAELEGKPASTIAGSMVDSFLPMMNQLIDAMEAMTKLPEEKRAQIAAVVESMESDVMGKVQDAQTAFTDVLNVAKE